MTLSMGSVAIRRWLGPPDFIAGEAKGLAMVFYPLEGQVLQVVWDVFVVGNKHVGNMKLTKMVCVKKTIKCGDRSFFCWGMEENCKGL